MSTESNDRIEMLEAHITMINKDLAKLAYYVDELLGHSKNKALKDYKDKMELCAVEMAKDVKEDCSEFLESNKLKPYVRQNKGE